MRPRPFLLLLAAIALALMAAGEADAGKEPEWNYTTGDGVDSVAISADGEYIAAGSIDRNVYLFDKNSSTPLWSYTAGHYVNSVAISADGEYIAAGSNDDKVYLFDKDSSTGGSPVATIDSITPSPARFDAEVTFSGTGSDSDGNVVAYLWKSSIDGELSTEEDFTTTNLSIGNHTITFMVQDNDGFTDTDTVEVTISEKKVQIDDEGNVTVTDAEEDEEGIPTLSVITTMAAVAVIALRRRY